MTDQNPPQNNDLPMLLANMMNDPEQHQGAFYEAFLTSIVFLMGETDDPTPGEKFVEGCEKVQIMHWRGPDGNPLMPLFLTKEELQASLQPDMPETNFVAITGYDALNLTRGEVPVAISPSSEACLFLVPEQIGQILNYFDSLMADAQVAQK